MQRLVMPATAVATVIMVVALAAATAASTPVAPTSTDPITVQILERASARIAETRTMRFHLQVEGDTFVDTDETIRLLEAEGELARPEQVRARFKVNVLGAVTVSIEIITVGDTTWSTDLVTGKWVEAPIEFTYDPGILFDQENGVGPVMGRVTDARRLDDEDIDGRAAFHIQAVVDEETIGPLTSYTMTGAPVTVDLWIDKETDDLLRARLEETTAPEGRDPATWTLDLFDHDEPITIDPPDTDE